MARKKNIKGTLTIIFLIVVIVTLIPDWIDGGGFSSIPGMAWVWFIVFLLWLWPEFLESYSENQKKKAANKAIGNIRKQSKKYKAKTNQ